MTTTEDMILLREDVDGVTTLTLNCPAKCNGLSEEMLAEIRRELTQIADDGAVRCVVLAANGKAFCRSRLKADACEFR